MRDSPPGSNGTRQDRAREKRNISSVMRMRACLLYTSAAREAIRQAASEPPVCAVTGKPENVSGHGHGHGDPGEERRLDPSQIGNGYMTMTPDYRITYMTMPEQGMPISYNTIPEYPKNEA